MDRLLKFSVAATIAIGLIFLKQAHATDLSGAWATNADQCSEVFIRRGKANQIGFTALSEQHGGGFIVEADRLRGKFAKCKISRTFPGVPDMEISYYRCPI